jgi:phage shock protein A
LKLAREQLLKAEQSYQNKITALEKELSSSQVQVCHSEVLIEDLRQKLQIQTSQSDKLKLDLFGLHEADRSMQVKLQMEVTELKSKL